MTTLRSCGLLLSIECCRLLLSIDAVANIRRADASIPWPQARSSATIADSAGECRDRPEDEGSSQHTHPIGSIGLHHNHHISNRRRAGNKWRTQTPARRPEQGRRRLHGPAQSAAGCTAARTTPQNSKHAAADTTAPQGRPPAGHRTHCRQAHRSGAAPPAHHSHSARHKAAPATRAQAPESPRHGTGSALACLLPAVTPLRTDPAARLRGHRRPRLPLVPARALADPRNHRRSALWPPSGAVRPSIAPIEPHGGQPDQPRAAAADWPAHATLLLGGPATTATGTRLRRMHKRRGS
ncbi:uncharacterized protein BJ171DRAFT_472232 [Polychytrium aggregatum]|uniref:uncharacterized protein n=1 Tax=Polychytrium aggregatum TaxID=110093 RepID=UPI0022FF0B78|nr:uncharacterized protein BJ171DRAFT_472232 [Polychytrium aggregatum]KAI9207937.1 hypothetical protein BJ171DRAFT_472232 [Polychytrium aggregatum]